MNADIRPYERGDAEALLEAVRESMAELAPWMPWCHPGYSIEDARGWIEATLEGHRSGTHYDFAIVAGAQLLGGCGINQIQPLDQVANLGYWVRSSCTGQGIATTAVRQLLRWGFENTELNRIEIVVAVGNRRSQRVAEKIGAHRDAVLARRTMVRGRPSAAVLYSVLRPEA